MPRNNVVLIVLLYFLYKNYFILQKKYKSTVIRQNRSIHPFAETKHKGKIREKMKTKANKEDRLRGFASNRICGYLFKAMKKERKEKEKKEREDSVQSKQAILWRYVQQQRWLANLTMHPHAKRCTYLRNGALHASARSRSRACLTTPAQSLILRARRLCPLSSLYLYPCFFIFLTLLSSPPFPVCSTLSLVPFIHHHPPSIVPSLSPSFLFLDRSLQSSLLRIYVYIYI